MGTPASSANASGPGSGNGVRVLAVLLAIQALGAFFFIVDAADDVASEGISRHILIEGLIALALLIGVVLGAIQLRTILETGRRQNAMLAVAGGALADLVKARFAEWKLTPAEAEVGLFALKGCDIAEIASLRRAAEGTVRAQLARVYAKANVGSRAALVSLFFDDLLDIGLPQDAAPHA